MPGDPNCPTGKRQYRTKAAAKTRLRKQKRMPMLNGRPRVRAVYLCRCGWWHLTSQKPRSGA